MTKKLFYIDSPKPNSLLQAWYQYKPKHFETSSAMAIILESQLPLQCDKSFL